MMIVIKAIIFDMDGLMIDSERVTYEGYQKIMGERGYVIDLSFYTTLLGRPITSIYQTFYDAYGNDFPIDEIINEVHLYIQNQFDTFGVPLKKGLIDLLKYLHQNKYKTMIATSSNRERVNRMLGTDGANILHYFNDSICGDEVKEGKPNPEVFLKACKKLAISPDEAYVLEDSEMGILAAHNAAIKCICVPDLKQPETIYAEKTYKIVTSLLDVITIIEG